MKIFRDMDQWRNFCKPASLGFVPTMGNLHQGHVSLMQKSLEDNEKSVASIFINPTQFNRNEDFTNYPRTLEADLEILEKTGVDYCLLPDETALYPDGFRFQIQETELSQCMEGAYRPGHFTGVLTIVMKLLHLVKPQKAYFGEKDYQQYLLIQKMCQAFFMDIEIIACPTIREPSGLAFSSRNNRLNLVQRTKAELFAALFHQKKSCEEISDELAQASVKVDYISEHFSRRFAAVWVDDIRLIDNFAL